MEIPDVRYARAGGMAIAYQVVGEGPETLVFSPQVSDLFTIWLSRYTRSFLEQLAARVRVVVLNPRGTGLSDRPRNIALEARMDDIASVLNEIDARRASLMGISVSANVCALFAATYPERTERLVLAHPYPRGIRSEGFPWGLDEDEWLGWIRENRQRWGDRDFMEEFAREVAPHVVADPEELSTFVWQGRLAMSPSAAADFVRMGMETDIVDILSSIRVPTLVLHRPGDPGNPAQGVGPAHFVAERIRDSRMLALHTDKASPFSREAADAILAFL